MPEDNENIRDCSVTKFRQLYQEYNHLDYYGALDNPYYTANVQDIGHIRRHGYLVNKNDLDVADWLAANNSFTWKLFDHIRIIQEKLVGIFKCDNQEFQLIMPQFLKEYLFSTVYVIYSRSVKNLEIELARKMAINNNEDEVEKINKLIPESNFRLFRHYKTSSDKWVWESVLAGIRDINLDKYIGKVLPLRASFNEGFMFPRLYHIFKQYEAQMQSYFRLFFVLNKSMLVNANTDTGLAKKIEDFYSVSPIIANVGRRTSDRFHAKKLEFVQEIPHLKEYYDNITTLLNDSLSELGFGGDTSTKCEKLTTAENFRDLLPNSTFQNTILHRLEMFSEQLQKRYKQKVKFENVLMANRQGLPILRGERVKMKENKLKEDGEIE